MIDEDILLGCHVMRFDFIKSNLNDNLEQLRNIGVVMKHGHKSLMIKASSFDLNICILDNPMPRINSLHVFLNE